MVGRLTGYAIDKNLIPADTDNTAVKNDTGSCFGSIMSKSMANQLKNSTKANAKNVNNSIINQTGKASDTKTQTVKTTDFADKTVSGKGKSGAVSNNSSGNKTSGAGSDSNVNNVADQDNDDAKETLSNRIKDYIKQQLDVTDDELDSAMQTLGLTYVDLFKADNVAKLVLELSGKNDLMSLITDDFQSAVLKNINNFMTKLSESYENINDNTNADLDASAFGADISDQGMEALADQTLADESGNITDDVKNNAADAVKNDITDQNAARNDAAADDNATQTLENILRQKIVTESGKDGASSNTGRQYGGNAQQNLSQQAAQDISQNLVQSLQQTFQSTAADMTDAQINTNNLIRQIVDTVKVMSSQTAQSMEIQLNPQSLGRLSINIIAKNGAITAQINVENEQVKKALESQMATLKENLEKQGIKVEAVEITFASHSFESDQSFAGNKPQENNAPKVSAKKINFAGINDDDADEISDADEKHSDIIANSNSSVEFTA